jgi:hypothetical protein
MSKGKPIAPLNPAHKGQFHRDVGKPQGAPITQADIAKGKASGNPAEVKRAVFAENAKGWNHHAHVNDAIKNHHKS